MPSPVTARSGPSDMPNACPRPHSARSRHRLKAPVLPWPSPDQVRGVVYPLPASQVERENFGASHAEKGYALRAFPDALESVPRLASHRERPRHIPRASEEIMSPLSLFLNIL